MLPKKWAQVIVHQMYCTQFYSVYFDMYNTCSKYLGSLELCLNCCQKPLPVINLVQSLLTTVRKLVSLTIAGSCRTTYKLLFLVNIEQLLLEQC